MLTQRRIAILVFVIQLLASKLFAQETVIDVTGNDFTHDEYVGTYGRQILVADNGDVHVVYQKSWITESDTGYNITWKNLTTGATDILPYQRASGEGDSLSSPGVAFIGGGSGSAPIYFYYGMGGRIDKWGGEGMSKRWSMYRASLAKLSDNGQTVVGLGVIQNDKYYYPPLPFPYPISMEVDPVTGRVHCLITNQDGFAVGYWNFDGTNFGEVYRMYYGSAINDTPGKAVPEKYRRNGTKGADLAVSADGSEVTIAGLHTACNIWLHKGIFGGELWDDDFFQAMDNGTCINLFDTTGTETGDNIPNNEPKPHTDLQVVYDENDKLVVVYTATYIDRWMDTSKTAPWANWANSFRVIDGDTIRADTTFDWSVNYTSMVGDTLGTFYDGSKHPKPQLRFWSEVSGSHSIITESIYPLLGDTLKFWEDGVIDSGYAAWGNGVNDGLISHINLISNNDAIGFEPNLVVTYSQCNSQPQMVVGGTESDGSAQYNYFSYYNDLFYQVSMDGATWWNPVNITSTETRDENDLSMHGDVVDTRIFLTYLSDSKAGRDDWLSKDPSNQLAYTIYKPKNIFGMPIRTDQNDQVQICFLSVEVPHHVGVNGGPSNLWKFELGQNYPNPFNPSTTIKYQISSVWNKHAYSHVQLKVYDILGREVATLVNKQQQAGSYEIKFDGSNLGSGIYFYNLRAGSFVKSRKMVLMK